MYHEILAPKGFLHVEFKNFIRFDFRGTPDTQIGFQKHILDSKN